MQSIDCDVQPLLVFLGKVDEQRFFARHFAAAFPCKIDWTEQRLVFQSEDGKLGEIDRWQHGDNGERRCFQDV